MAELDPVDYTETIRRKRPALSVASLLLVVFVVALLPVILVKKEPFAFNLLDLKGPEIKTGEGFPRGIGLASTRLSFEVDDSGAGIAEISVSVSQGGDAREIYREIPQGVIHRQHVTIALEGVANKLVEGEAELFIRAVDRSYWARASELRLSLPVDLQKPLIEVYPEDTTSLTEGSSTLIFYKARDRQLVLTGVKVGGSVFTGFPAQEIDKRLTDPTLFVCLYAIPLGSKDSPRVFAEDFAGNSSSAVIQRNVTKRVVKSIARSLTDAYIRDQVTQLLALNGPRIEAAAQAASFRLHPLMNSAGPDVLLQWLSVFTSRVRPADSEEISMRAIGLEFEPNWSAPFLRPQGEIQSGFGEDVSYTWNGKGAFSYLQTGYEISATRDVLATQEGLVTLLGKFGWYGNVVVIDHGLSLQTVYAGLDTINVLRGQRIQKGQPIALSGASGGFPQHGYFYEMRVGGVPVEAQDWGNSAFFSSEVTKKIEAATRVTGIASPHS